MPRETKAAKAERAAAILTELRRLYPDAHCALTHRNAFELIVATILSAQCTDARVNMVTPALFKRCPTPRKLAAIEPDELETIIRSTGFYRNKAKNLRGMAQALLDDHDGDVPNDMDALLKLPGVARKTANVVLGNAFGKNVGVVVDTHVGRLAGRMDLTRATDPVKIERDLMPLFPTASWTDLSHLLIFHGRRVCAARKPRCEDCEVESLCPQRGVTGR